MKAFQKLTCLMMAFMLVGCTNGHTDSSSLESEGNESIDNKSAESISDSSSEKDSSASPSSASTSEGPHNHNWSTVWSSNNLNHWHACDGCAETKDIAAHELEDVVYSYTPTSESNVKFPFANPKKGKKCKVCGYVVADTRSALPEVRFTSNVASDISFATTARSDDLERPEVSGTITITNCPEKYQINNLAGTMKVRGNQTAGWAKKGFRMKIDSKPNLLGLNKGRRYKKWVLMADAKDTALIRTALGLYISRGICEDEGKVWASDFIPVSVYLNDEYWGYYYLAEQKETKAGRINLPEPEDRYQGIDIGYCFELDNYADREPRKTDGGDPTFTLDYGNSFTERSFTIESALARGPIKKYTMLSDITDGPEGVALNESNSNQVKFIRNRLQALYNVLYQGAVNKVAKTVNENNQVVDFAGTVEQAIRANFNLDSWAEGFIINGFDCAPDLGYSSFYMSFDNTENGEKKLRFDNPWDFDSNFGNRNNFITTADSASSDNSWGGWGGWGGSSYDPYYLDRTSNMWIQFFSKLDFFMEIVKEKWNKVRDSLIFENMFKMMRTYFADYDAEFKRNFVKWPKNDAEYELRDPFKNPRDYLKAEEETINWCAKRINYLEKQWGKNRPDIVTTL